MRANISVHPHFDWDEAAEPAPADDVAAADDTAVLLIAEHRADAAAADLLAQLFYSARPDRLAVLVEEKMMGFHRGSPCFTAASTPARFCMRGSQRWSGC